MSVNSENSAQDPKKDADKPKTPEVKQSKGDSSDDSSGDSGDSSNEEDQEESEELVILEGDPAEPGKTETISQASDTVDIDKLIGRGLKPPPVQDDGLW